MLSSPINQEKVESPQSKTPERPKKQIDLTIKRTPKKYPSKSGSHAKAIEEQAQNPMHNEIRELLEEMGATYGPILAEIHKLYTERLKDDDDFLRRQKNRVEKVCTEEREEYMTITSQWTTELEAAVKERVHSLQNSPASTSAAAADSEEPEKEAEAQKEKQQQDMDSGINVVILKMLGQYQDRLRKKKKEFTKDLQKIETESFKSYQMNVAEQERDLLSLFNRLSLAIQENAIPRNEPQVDRAATLVENVNPNITRNQAGSRAKLENKDIEMEMGMEIKNLVTPPSGTKKRRVLPS